MIKKLDEVGVFIRGDNNSRKVDINLTWEDMIKLLTSPTLDNQEKINEIEIENCDNEAVQTE